MADRRRDGVPPGPRLGVAVAPAAAGSLGVLWAVLQSTDDRRIREHWRNVHEAAATAAAQADVEAVAGTVAIHPGERLEIDIRLTVATRPGTETHSAWDIDMDEGLPVAERQRGEWVHPGSFRRRGRRGRLEQGGRIRAAERPGQRRRHEPHRRRNGGRRCDPLGARDRALTRRCRTAHTRAPNRHRGAPRD